MDQLAQDRAEALALLTDKHRACLELALRRRMTSKQIARELGISKDAVDQRMASARRLLGARDRDHTVLIYAELTAAYDRIVCHPVELPSRSLSNQEALQERGHSSLLSLREMPMHLSADWERPAEPMFLGVSIDQLGDGQRTVIIVVISVAIMAMVLIALAISQALSNLIAA